MARIGGGVAAAGAGARLGGEMCATRPYPSLPNPQGLIDPNFDPKPLSKALDPETGGCVVNLHYHLGTEHYNNATFSEDGAAFLHKVMQCERANYKDMEKDNLMLNGELLTYNNLSDTVFCCEMRNHNYLP